MMSNSPTSNVSINLLLQLQSTAIKSGRDDLAHLVAEAIKAQCNTPAVAWYVKVEDGHNELFFEEARANEYAQACREALRTVEIIPVPGQVQTPSITSAPKSNDHARMVLERLVALWDRDECLGSPNHDHLVPGKWDGDTKHPKGSKCLECEAYTDARALLKSIQAGKIEQSPTFNIKREVLV